MKKYYLALTIGFALSACAGGGGGGHDGAPELRAATLIGSSASDNSEITSMASAVVVKNGSSYVDIARSAHAPDTTSHAGYTIYRLDNVDFKLAGTDDATFNFEINDDGRIIRAIGNGQEIDRDTEDSRIFRGKIFQFVKEGDDREVITVMDNDPDHPVDQARLDSALAQAVSDGKLTQAQADAGSWNYLEQTWQFSTSGSDKNLTYSDFGYFTSTNVRKVLGISFDESGNVQGTDKPTDHSAIMVFAGGYDILPETVRPENGARYEGTAIGVITTNIEGEGSSSYKETYGHGWNPATETTPEHYNTDETATLMTQHAWLEIDNNGKTVIGMPFGSQGTATDITGNDTNIQWYDIEINDGVFSFNLPDGVDAEDITTRFSHDDDTADRAANNVHESVNEGYYGVTTPLEATGTVVYEQEHTLAPGITREFNFEGAYGMTGASGH